MSNVEIEAYYNQLINYSGDDIISILPNKSVYGFEDAMEAIIHKLKTEIVTLNSFLNEGLNEEERKTSLREIERLNNLINVCYSHLTESTSFEQTQEVIFAKTPGGNYYFEGDYKKIKREKREELNKIMLHIFGIRHDKSTYPKKMRNNGKLKGVIEYKTARDQVRVYAKRIKDNIIYIFGVVTKKDDWTNQINDTLGGRMNHVNTTLEEIKKMSDQELNALLSESNKLISELFTIKNGDQDSEEITLFFSNAVFDDGEAEKVEILDVNDHFDSLSDDDWYNIFSIAKAIYDEKGFLDFSDVRALEIDLGSWIDYQIQNINKIPDNQKIDLLSLVSNKNTRVDKVVLPHDDFLLSHYFSKIYDSMREMSKDELDAFQESLGRHK